MHLNKETLQFDTLERLALSLIIVCGLSAPKKAIAASEHYEKPSAQEQWHWSFEVEEHSVIAKAIDSVPYARIRAEGYHGGDVAALKQRAKSQIPLLYGYYESIHSPLPYPQLNIDALANGIRIHYTIPDREMLEQTDYTLNDIEAAIGDIEKKVRMLTGMPVQRVDRREDATIPFSFYKPKTESGRIIAWSGMFPRTPHATTSFSPLGTVIPTEKNGSVHIPLVGMRRYDRFLEEQGAYNFSLGLKQFLRKQSMRDMGIHEIIHAMGFLHIPDKDHILALEPGPVAEEVDKSIAKKYPEESFIDENGRCYATRDYLRNIQNSPLADLFLFLRIFAKQHKEQQEDKREDSK